MHAVYLLHEVALFGRYRGRHLEQWLERVGGLVQEKPNFAIVVMALFGLFTVIFYFANNERRHSAMPCAIGTVIWGAAGLVDGPQYPCCVGIAVVFTPILPIISLSEAVGFSAHLRKNAAREEQIKEWQVQIKKREVTAQEQNEKRAVVEADLLRDEEFIAHLYKKRSQKRRKLGAAKKRGNQEAINSLEQEVREYNELINENKLAVAQRQKELETFAALPEQELTAFPEEEWEA